MQKLSKFESDVKLQNIDLTELMVKVHPELSGTLVTFDTKHKTQWTLIMSEMGLCFSVNSLFVDLLSLKYLNSQIIDIN